MLFFLTRYVCTETDYQVTTQGGCNCSPRQMRTEILCAVEAAGEVAAAEKLGGRCGGYSFRMDPDSARYGDLNDCQGYKFEPGEFTHAIVLSSLGRMRDHYIEKIKKLFAPDDQGRPPKDLYLITSHLAGEKDRPERDYPETD